MVRIVHTLIAYLEDEIEMEIAEIARVQEYLRKSLSNNRVVITPPPRPGAPVEVNIADEFVGVLYKDEDEGEVSYTFMMTILEMDLASPSGVPLIKK